MAETTNSTRRTRLPDTSSQLVRQRWLELLDLSYSTRRVTEQEIESGVHAVVVPAICRKETNRDLVEAEVRVASSRVPGMARGVRLSMDRLGEFAVTAPADYHGWMGSWGKDVTAGETLVTAFVDLAYLEAAMLARLWDHQVQVEFGSPMAFFRRGSISDYINIYEAVMSMLAEGRSLADTADQLALEVLKRLQLYANVYLQFSSIYSQGSWHINHDNFVIEVPTSRFSLSLQYWELRGDLTSVQNIIVDWRRRIDILLQQAAANPGNEYPASYAA